MNLAAQSSTSRKIQRTKKRKVIFVCYLLRSFLLVHSHVHFHVQGCTSVAEFSVLPSMIAQNPTHQITERDKSLTQPTTSPATTEFDPSIIATGKRTRQIIYHVSMKFTQHVQLPSNSKTSAKLSHHATKFSCFHGNPHGMIRQRTQGEGKKKRKK